MSKSNVTRTSLSLPPKVLTAGRKNARRKLRNFSSYIAELIQKDDQELSSTAPNEAAAR